MGDCTNCEKDKLSVEVIHQTLQENLKRELSNFWQRSLFVWSFLLLAYTGYGALMLKIGTDDALWGNTRGHLMATAVAVLGLFFSYLWILMAKASKAWYEIHEAVLRDFGRCYSHRDNAEYFKSRTIDSEESLDKTPIDDKNTDWGKRLDIYVGFDYCRSELIKARRRPTNDSWHSLKAGDYSPSRIVILFGIVSFLMWILIIFLHIVMIVYLKCKECPSWRCLIICGVLLVVTFFCGYCIGKHFKTWLPFKWPQCLRDKLRSDFLSSMHKQPEDGK